LEVVGRLRDALQKAGKSAAIHTYPGAQHAFFNDTNPDRYHAEASRDAWEKTLAFLQTNLK
ncbi:MAG: dienelactone hydrolase family protein, partial [Chloroflexi bacterium]|nr:dienelactone hydrolase family protein [Chloroflexota bacterium]